MWGGFVFVELPRRKPNNHQIKAYDYECLFIRYVGSSDLDNKHEILLVFLLINNWNVITYI